MITIFLYKKKNKNMMKKLVIFIMILLPIGQHVKAQWTIGSNKAPEGFSLLEIDSSEGGLRHPQMTTEQRDAFTQTKIITPGKAAEARGLMIFNTTYNCLEYYKSQAEGWVSLCDAGDIADIPLDQTAIIRPYTSAEPVLSDGTFGKRKYDVAQSALNSNVTGSCGLLGAAHGRPGDFNTANDYKRYYVLEFATDAEMTQIKDIVIGIRQFEVETVTVTGSKPGGGEAPNTFSRLNNIVVNFSSTGTNAIKTVANGRVESNALYTTIYALFRRNGELRRAEYTFLAMDCLGCGVREQSGAGQWVRTACYNLGVVESSSTPSPFAYNALLNGDMYQWGRKTDGHEKATSSVFTLYPAIGELAYPTTPLDLLDANGQPMNKTPFNFRVGKFIPATTDSQTHFYSDWSVAHDAKLWGDGTGNPQMPKTVNDPCPTGFRLPTLQEMTIIMNVLTVDDTKQGAVATGGEDKATLYLPYTSVRGIDGVVATGTTKAQYWTSTTSSTSTTAQVKALNLGTASMSVVDADRALGSAVRCVAE